MHLFGSYYRAQNLLILARHFDSLQLWWLRSNWLPIGKLRWLAVQLHLESRYLWAHRKLFVAGDTRADAALHNLGKLAAGFLSFC